MPFLASILVGIYEKEVKCLEMRERASVPLGEPKGTALGKSCLSHAIPYLEFLRQLFGGNGKLFGLFRAGATTGGLHGLSRGLQAARVRCGTQGSHGYQHLPKVWHDKGPDRHALP